MEHAGAREVVWRPVADLVPYARNAREHSDDQVEMIAASIQRFGFNAPVLIDEDGGIIAGHGRVMAAHRLGWEQVPTIELAHLSEEEKRAYVIADNRIAEESTWNDDLLAEELKALDDLDFDLGTIGFSDKELAKLMAEPDPQRRRGGPAGLAGAGDEGDDDDGSGVGEGGEPGSDDEPEPIAERGDLWQLGDHLVLCGDSADAESYEALMAGGLANLVVTDPPYGVDFERGKYVGRDKAGENSFRPIANDHLKGDALREFCAGIFKHVADAAMEGCPVYAFSPSMLEGFAILQAVIEGGFHVKTQIIWQKVPFVIGRNDYHWEHEVCWYGWKGKGHPWYGGRDQKTVWTFPKPRAAEKHPTMKPVAMIEKALRNSSRRGDVVLDPFGGSGSTLIACEKRGRAARLIEWEPVYVDVIIRRWEKLTGGTAALDGDGRTFAEVERERRAAAA